MTSPHAMTTSRCGKIYMKCTFIGCLMFRVILSDIEGCITPGKGYFLDHESISKISKYNMESEKNLNLPPLTLITGRPQPYVEALLQMIGGFTPSICENGAIIYFPKEDFIKINPEIKKDAINALTKIKNELIQELVLKRRARIEPGKEICISLNPTETIPKKYYQKLGELYSEVSNIISTKKRFVNITRSKSAVDITPYGIDKYSGLKVLSSILDVDIAHIVGIGDSEGDLSFLKHIGHATCPNNAIDEVKIISKFVSNYPHAEGVCDIIYQINRLNGYNIL